MNENTNIRVIVSLAMKVFLYITLPLIVLGFLLQKEMILETATILIGVSPIILSVIIMAISLYEKNFKRAILSTLLIIVLLCSQLISFV